MGRLVNGKHQPVRDKSAHHRHPLIEEIPNDAPERIPSMLREIARLSRESEGEIGLDGIVVKPGESWTSRNP
jgi:hypothetical protein